MQVEEDAAAHPAGTFDTPAPLVLDEPAVQVTDGAPTHPAGTFGSLPLAPEAVEWVGAPSDSCEHLQQEVNTLARGLESASQRLQAAEAQLAEELSKAAHAAAAQRTAWRAWSTERAEAAQLRSLLSATVRSTNATLASLSLPSLLPPALLQRCADVRRLLRPLAA